MREQESLLTDSFGRQHTYLRISLTELCNLRCTYCMPADGVKLSPRDHIMSYEEIFALAKLFVKHGVTKIRLTGGEPLVRKDVHKLMDTLASLPVELSISTNGIKAHDFIDVFKRCNIQNINVSLDTLNAEKFNGITRRDRFQIVRNNIQLLISEGFNVKVNAVLMKDFNEDEIIDFVQFTRENPISMRFIEFMPFDGNQWNMSKLVSYADIMDCVHATYNSDEVLRLQDAPNDTSKNYRIKGYMGSFAIISTVTNPFCDSCNRLRLTANGQLKNCLFSATENDLLTGLREGKDIEPLIKMAVASKQKIRGGMDSLQKLKDPELHSQNRSMISIGG